jgi:ubiquinone biosynthesis protein
MANWITTGPLRAVFDPRGKNRKSRSERLRLIIEDLGPTFIKFGQILADRPDLASENLRLELKKLQSSARPLDDDVAIQIIEKELGNSMDNLFYEFNPKHIASASIGQIYRAKLITGEEVVLKVQRPNIREKIKLDIILLKIFARKITKTYPELSTFNIVAFVEDFGQIVLKELDFNNEQSNMLRFSNMFKDDDRVYIPKIFNKFCTPRILTMEFIDGDSPDNVELLKSKGYNIHEIAENGVNVILTMILKHGFFHADPHAGNIFIRENNQLVLIDHGMCASLKPKQIDGLVGFLLGFADKNPHKIAKSLLKLTEVNHLPELENLEFEIKELIEKYAYLSYENVDISGLFTDTFKLLMKYGINVPSSLYMLLKTLITIQKVAENLQVNIDLIALIKPYAKAKIKEKFTWDSIKSRLVNVAEDYLYLVETLPKDIRAIVTNFKEDGIRHQVKFGEDGMNNKQIKGLVYKFGSYVLLGVLLICATLLKIYNVETVKIHQGKTVVQSLFGDFPDYFFVSTVIISVFVVLRLMFKSQN